MEFLRRPLLSRRPSTASVRWCAVAVLLGGFASAASEARAQGPTTVQLPETRQFGVSTSVLVPDQGGIVLGGVGRSSQSSASRGVPGASKISGAGRMFGQRAIGRDTEAATVSAHVWVHDLAEMDEAVLDAARPRTTDSDVDRKADFLSKHVGRAGADSTAARPVPPRSNATASTRVEGAGIARGSVASGGIGAASRGASSFGAAGPAGAANVRARTSRSPAGPR